MANRFRHIEEPVFEEETELLSSQEGQTKESSEASNPSPDDSKPEAATAKGDEKGKKKTSWMRQVFGGEMLMTRKALRQIPLVMLIIFFCILMVSNRYTMENLRKEIVQTRKEIDELSMQQIQLKSQYQQSIKISTIANSLDSAGVSLVTEPPLTLKRK